MNGRHAITDYLFAKRKEVFGGEEKDFANTAVLMRKFAGAALLANSLVSDLFTCRLANSVTLWFGELLNITGRRHCQFGI